MMDDIWKQHAQMFRDMAQMFGSVLDDSMPEIMFGKIYTGDYETDYPKVAAESPREEMLLAEPDDKGLRKEYENYRDVLPQPFSSFPHPGDIFPGHSRIWDSFREFMDPNNNNPYEQFSQHDAPSVRMSSSQKSVRIITRPDGSCEEHHTVRDNNGNLTETIIKRQDGHEHVTVIQRTPNGEEKVQDSSNFSDLFRGSSDSNPPVKNPGESIQPIKIRTPNRNDDAPNSWGQSLLGWWDYLLGK